MKVKNGFVIRQIAGEWIAVAVGKRTAEFPGVIAFSETAAFVWEQLSKGIWGDRLIETLVSEFEVYYDTAKKDVEAFIESLKEEGLLEDE